MEVITYAYTSKIYRNKNEDYYDYNFRNNRGCFVVADGLGGHLYGEVASRMAVESIISQFETVSDFSAENIQNMVINANDEIIKMQLSNPAYKGMRTTLVAAFADNDKLSFIHKGDSRFYYFRNNTLFLQSKDHTVSQLSVDMGEITTDQIRFHEDRNKLLKVLGNQDQTVTVEPVTQIQMLPGDSFLLCTDGFWEHIYEEEMSIDLLKSAQPTQWLDFMLTRILNRLTYGNDNLTAICSFIK